MIARSFCDAHFARKRKLIVTKHFERNCGHFLCPQNPPVSHSGTVPRRLAASNVLRAGQPLTRKSNALWESVSSSVRRYLTIYAQIRAPSTIRIDAGVRLCRPLDRFQGVCALQGFSFGGVIKTVTCYDLYNYFIEDQVQDEMVEV